MSKSPARPPARKTTRNFSSPPFQRKRKKILNEVKPPLISICLQSPPSSKPGRTNKEQGVPPPFIRPLPPPRKIKGMASLSCHSHERGRRVRGERMLNCFSFAPRLIRRESRERLEREADLSFSRFFCAPGESAESVRNCSTCERAAVAGREK